MIQDAIVAFLGPVIASGVGFIVFITFGWAVLMSIIYLERKIAGE